MATINLPSGFEVWNRSGGRTLKFRNQFSTQNYIQNETYVAGLVPVLPRNLKLWGNFQGSGNFIVDGVIYNRVFTVNITTTGPNYNFIIPLYSGSLTANTTINWGDGTVNTGTASHTYAVTGSYVIQVSGSVIPLFQWTSSEITSIPSIGDTITDLSGMFISTTVTTLPDLSLSDWKTALITNMHAMFNSAVYFNQDISSWDTSSVTDMGYMFTGANAFNSVISGWNTSKVTDMNNMFNGATVFNSVISSWNTSSVTYMNNMFHGATVFNQDISSWDISSVTNMSGMFTGSGLTAANASLILIGWASQTVTAGVTLTISSSAFTYPAGISPAGVTAAAVLTGSPYNWTIN